MSDRRALWLVPVAPLGGVARHVLDATRAGVPGWQITVLCPDGALAERLRAQGTPVITADFGPDFGLRASRRALATAVKSVRPELVHSHLAYADIVSACTRLPGVWRCTTEHGIAGDDVMYHRSSLQAKAMALVHRLRFRRFAVVIAVSQATRAAMLAKWRVRQPITVILNGVDAPIERRTVASGLRLLALARLSPEKRLDRLIEAFALVREQRAEATLTIAGEGPLRDELMAQADRAGVEVDLPGFVDADEAMDQADVIVQLSVWENCSYTLLDAVARGMRVVASRVGGNPEIVDEASLVRGDDPHEVARAVLAATGGSGPTPMPVPEMCAKIATAYAEVRR